MKKLGFGLMRLPISNPEDNKTIDIPAVEKMVDAFLAEGFTYFDTAYFYHGGMSEIAFREAVAKRYPRESFSVTDKMPMMYSPTVEDMERIFAEQLERCGVEYFDYYWLHALGRESYAHSQKVDAFGYISKLKEEGKVKHIGFSFHDDAEVLEQILSEHPEVEVVQLQINYLDWEDENVEARKCYEVCEKYGKEVVIMEPVKGGSLATVPDKVEKMFKEHNPKASVASWAIRYAASLDLVFTVLSGMSNEEQLLDNISYMKEFEPLSKKEQEIVTKAADMIKESIAVPCTFCHYCTDGCPKKIAIPEVFAIYNEFKRHPKSKKEELAAEYEELTKDHGRTSDCITCKKCEKHCPQHIEITKELSNFEGALGIGTC